MKLLLIESAPGIAFDLEDRLVADGHQILSCVDAAGGPCKGIGDASQCPLQMNPDLVVHARSGIAAPTLNEAGVLCARRRHLPTVHVESATAQAELAAPGEIDTVAIRAAHCVEHEYESAVERALVDLDALATVERTGRRLAVTVRVPDRPGETPERWRIADRARHALRRFDPHMQVIDVSVVLTLEPHLHSHH